MPEKLVVLFLFPHSSKKLRVQNRSSSQVLKALFMGRTYAAFPSTWKCFTSITVKFELSSYVTGMVVFLLQKN